MAFQTINLYNYNTFCICVNNIDTTNTISGILLHPCIKCSVSFYDINDLFLKMDQILDELQYPQASTQSRTFYPKKHRIWSWKYTKKGFIPMETEKNNMPEGQKGTFLVHIQYRQNATWQGTINWGEKNIKVPFRSALEMIKLMDNALNDPKAFEETVAALIPESESKAEEDK